MRFSSNSATYGGGGIHGLYSTVAADSVWAPYLFVHEFGHQIAGLADEYYTSDVAYLPASDRRRAVGAERDGAPRSGDTRNGRISSTAGTPIPTPWPKERFEQHATLSFRNAGGESGAAGRPEAEIDALMREQMCIEIALLGASPFADRVGAFEGANYAARGFFRPEVDCIMFSRNPAAFCRVCVEAIREILDLYSRGLRARSTTAACSRRC